MFTVGFANSHGERFGGVTVKEVQLLLERTRLFARLYYPLNGVGKPRPAVILFHGYLGNSSVMEAPFAIELARRGFVVLSPDYSGHGRSQGGIRNSEFFGERLDPSMRRGLAAITSYLRHDPAVDPDKIAVLGHSAGARTAGYLASIDQRIVATIYVAGLLDGYLFDSASAPNNLMLAYGRDDHYVGRDISHLTGIFTWVKEPGTFAGSYEDGSARIYHEYPGLDHYSILFSPRVRQDAIGWIERSTGQPSSARPVARMPFGWLALGEVGIAVGLAPFASVAAWFCGVRPRPVNESSISDHVRAHYTVWRVALFCVAIIVGAVLVPYLQPLFSWIPASGAGQIMATLWALGIPLALSFPLATGLSSS